MMTSSAKRTLTGLVFNFAFLAALINADLGDLNEKKQKRTTSILKTIRFLRDESCDSFLDHVRLL